MKRFLPLLLLLVPGSAVAQLHEYKATDIRRRISRRRKCQLVSFLLNPQRENGSPTLNGRITPRTPSLVLRTHLSESPSKAHVR